MTAFFEKVDVILKLDIASARFMKMRGTVLVARKRDEGLSG
jgi:hypothetical protein